MGQVNFAGSGHHHGMANVFMQAEVAHRGSFVDQSTMSSNHKTSNQWSKCLQSPILLLLRMTLGFQLIGLVYAAMIDAEKSGLVA